MHYSGLGIIEGEIEMGTISQTAKRPKNPRNRSYKTNVATEIDFSDLKLLASQDEVKTNPLSGTAIAELCTIAGAPLTIFKLRAVNDIFADYVHQKKQGSPSKPFARWQLQNLAQICASADTADTVNKEVAVSVGNLNGVAYNRLTSALRALPEWPRGRAAGQYIFDPAASPALLGKAAAIAARHTTQGDYSDATVHLTVQRLTDLFKNWSGLPAKYSHNSRNSYTTFARSQAARFVECFFRHAESAFPVQTPLNSLSGLLKMRKKAAARKA